MTKRETRVQLAGMLLIAATTSVVFWIASGPGDAAQAAIVLVAFALLIHVGRTRSDTLATMGGIGDERTRNLYLRATSWAGNVMAFVLPGWWLVTLARGNPDNNLSALCCVFAVSFVGAAAVLARRG